jgi:hypothetical protein
MPREYAVGYKKPPSEYRFKKGNSAANCKTSRKDKVPDLVNHLDRPLKAERGGKRVNVHPFEAATLSLVREALKGKPSAIKKAIQIFEKAGLLEPPPGKQTHGVLTAPKNLDLHFFCILLKILGPPPWDPGVHEAALAEYQQDQAEIEELRRQFLKGQDNG